MQETFPYTKLASYPHMMPFDVAIWERFIEQFPDMYDHVSYDVKVGSIPEFVKNEPDVTHQAQAPLYQRKIDVVGYKADQIDIIEIKPRAGTSALGQVVGYKLLYQRDFTPPVEPKAIVLTDHADDDLGHVAASMGVQVVVV
jgi:hypothetical protein